MKLSAGPLIIRLGRRGRDPVWLLLCPSCYSPKGIASAREPRAGEPCPDCGCPMVHLGKNKQAARAHSRWCKHKPAPRPVGTHAGRGAGQGKAGGAAVRVEPLGPSATSKRALVAQGRVYAEHRLKEIIVPGSTPIAPLRWLLVLDAIEGGLTQRVQGGEPVGYVENLVELLVSVELEKNTLV
jgi:hypothetical protein